MIDVFWQRILPINESTLEGASMTMRDLEEIASYYEFDPIGIYPSDLDVATYDARRWNLLTSIREFIQNAMDAECGYKIMCRPSMFYKDGYMYITNTGESIDEAFVTYGFSTKRENRSGASFLYRGHFGEGAKGAVATLLFNGYEMIIYSRRQKGRDLVFYPVVYRGYKGGRLVDHLGYIVGESNVATSMGKSVVIRIKIDEHIYHTSRQLVFVEWLDMLKRAGVPYTLVPLHEYVKDEIYQLYLQSLVSPIEARLGDQLVVDNKRIIIPKSLFENYIVLIDDSSVDNRLYVKDIYVGEENRFLSVGTDPKRTNDYTKYAVSYNLYFAELEPNRRKTSTPYYYVNALYIAHTIEQVLEYLLKYRHKRAYSNGIVVLTLDSYEDTSHDRSAIFDKSFKISIEQVVPIITKVLNQPIEDFMVSGVPIIVPVRNAKELVEAKAIFSALHVNRGVIIVNDIIREITGVSLKSIKSEMAKRLDTRSKRKLLGYPYDQIAKAVEIMTLDLVRDRLLLTELLDVEVSIDEYEEESEAGGSSRFNPDLGKGYISIRDEIVNGFIKEFVLDMYYFSPLSELISVVVHEIAHIIVDIQNPGKRVEAHGYEFSKALETLLRKMSTTDEYARLFIFAMYGILPENIFEIKNLGTVHLSRLAIEILYSPKFYRLANDIIELATYESDISKHAQTIVREIAIRFVREYAPYFIVERTGGTYSISEVDNKTIFETLRSVTDPTDPVLVANKLFSGNSKIVLVVFIDPTKDTVTVINRLGEKRVEKLIV